MANKKISAALDKASLEATDMIPVAQAGSAQAWHVTGQTLFDSIPPATEASPGTVELATAAEVTAATDGARAVTPASLFGNLTIRHLANGALYIGQVTSINDKTGIGNLLTAITGLLAPQDGDLFLVRDNLDNMYLFVFEGASGDFQGFNMTTGGHLTV